MEADLSRYHHLDYRDRWRFDGGRRLLTLRMIIARLRHLPPDSATAMADGGDGWTLRDHLLADLFHATAGIEHPGRPKRPTKATAPRAAAIRSARRRAAERARAIEAGEIT